MFFRQLQTDGGVHCAYVLADLDARVAVVVDPMPSLAEAVAELLDRHGLRLVGCLETFVRLEPEDATESRFNQLVASLGLDATPSQGPGRVPWKHVPRGGPVSPWMAVDGESGTLFSWNGLVRELAADADTVYDAANPTVALVHRALRLPLGSGVIEVLPTGDAGDAVAYKVDDRLITGAVLASDPSAPGGPCTGSALLVLPSDTWVYPRRAGEQLHATLEDELLAWTREQEARTQPPLDERGFLPVIAGSEPTVAVSATLGTATTQGYRDVVPADALMHLGFFDAIVMVDDLIEPCPTLPGAEVLRHADVVRMASDWDEQTRLLLISEMGDRCASTARALVHNGLRGVHRLVGGVNLWESCGLPTELPQPQRRRA